MAKLSPRGNLPDPAQRMPQRNTRLKIGATDQRTARHVRRALLQLCFCAAQGEKCSETRDGASLVIGLTGGVGLSALQRHG